MPMNSTVMSDAVKTMYERRLLMRAVPRFMHGKFATVAKLSKFGSYELRRYESVNAVTTPLVDGNTPAEGSAPTITKVTLAPLWYGSWLGYTDELDLRAYDDTISETSGILGEQAGLSFDTLIRTDLTDGATVDYSGDATGRSGLDTTNDKISFSDFIGALALLEVKNAMPADGSMVPVFLHPYSWAQLMQDTTFVTLFTREGGDAIRTGRMGNILNASVYVSSNARYYDNEGASNVDVYSALFIGRESYGIAGMSNVIPNLSDTGGGAEKSNNTGRSVKPVTIIVKGLGETGHDPLDQRGTIGWKGTFDGAILNSNWIINLEHTTSYSL